MNISEKINFCDGFGVKCTNLREKDFLIFLYRQVSGKKGKLVTEQAFILYNYLNKHKILTVTGLAQLVTKTLWRFKIKNITSVPTTKRNQVVMAFSGVKLLISYQKAGI